MAGQRPTVDRRPGDLGSDFSLLRHLKRIVDLDAKISYCALKLGMAEEQLNGAEVFCAAINQRRLRAAHRVGAVRGVVESD